MGKVKMFKYVSMVALTLTVSPGTLPMNFFSTPAAQAAKQQQTSFFDNFQISSSGGTYNLKFSTNNSVKVQVSYALKDSKDMTTVSSSKSTTKHQFKLELSPNSQYTAVITVIDGKSTESETISFDTSALHKVTVLSKEVSYSTTLSEIHIQNHEGFESEYNGDINYADNMDSATNYIGRIACADNDNDYFKIDFSQAKTSGKLNVFLDVPSNKDYELYLYYADGSAVTSSMGGTGVDELISKTGMTPGVYYARVVGYNGSCDDVNTYSLRWRFYPDVAVLTGFLIPLDLVAEHIKGPISPGGLTGKVLGIMRFKQ